MCTKQWQIHQALTQSELESSHNHMLLFGTPPSTLSIQSEQLHNHSHMKVSAASRTSGTENKQMLKTGSIVWRSLANPTGTDSAITMINFFHLIRVDTPLPYKPSLT